MPAFLTDAVLKRDVFSETQKGHMAGDPATPVIRRIVTASPAWTRPLAWALAKREIKALGAAAGIEGTPRLIETDRHGLFRTWSEGVPLHLARPGDKSWYLDAHRLLRELRRRGITHNDLAKPQNWLMTPNGRAAVIDFQLASLHRRRGALFRALAYEDFRHLVKQRKAFAPNLMTPTARRVLRERSAVSRLWRSTGKRIYVLVTRGLFGWSDREGAGNRLAVEGPAIAARLQAQPGVRAVSLIPFPLPLRGTGIYAFVECDGDWRGAAAGADLVQRVQRLPRGPDGTVREDLLQLVALNQIDSLDAALVGDPAMHALMQPIIEERRNLSDRRPVPDRRQA